MNSKMRPQMMAFDNVDAGCLKGGLGGRMNDDLEDVVLIYKKGDDLRQDRLTLQLLKVRIVYGMTKGYDPLKGNKYYRVTHLVGKNLPLT